MNDSLGLADLWREAQRRRGLHLSAWIRQVFALLAHMRQQGPAPPPLESDSASAATVTPAAVEPFISREAA
jgi:hypothetical protein